MFIASAPVTETYSAKFVTVSGDTPVCFFVCVVLRRVLADHSISCPDESFQFFASKNPKGCKERTLCRIGEGHVGSKWCDSSNKIVC